MVKFEQYTLVPLRIPGRQSWAVYVDGEDQGSTVLRLVGHADGDTPKDALLDYLDSVVTDALETADAIRAGTVLIKTEWSGLKRTYQ